jgi:hypothetical protein
MEHTIVDGDSGEKLVCSSAGMGCDPADKGIYKALTGAQKYFLQKLFFITDQTDPEADVAADHRAAPEKHKPTRKYEEETSRGNKASDADLDMLRQFLTEEKIDEEFVMKLVAEGKLDANAQSLDDLKPGVLTKLLTLRKRIKERWQLATKGVDKNRRMTGNGQPASRGKPQAQQRRRAEPEDEDQTPPEERTFIMAEDISPEDYLEQEGKSWQEVEIHFGSKQGTALGDMKPDDLSWWVNNWTPKKYRGKFEEDTILLDAALCVAQGELIGG